MMLAVVENSLAPAQHEESVVRLYEVGRLRADAEEDGGEADDADEEANQDEQEGDSDGKNKNKPFQVSCYYSPLVRQSISFIS